MITKIINSKKSFFVKLSFRSKSTKMHLVHEEDEQVEE